MAGFSLGGFAQLFTGWNLPDNKANAEQEKKLDAYSLDAVLPENDSLIRDTTLGFQTTAMQDTAFQSQAQLINEYRVMAMNQDVDSAVDDIVNAVVSSDEDVPPLSIVVSNLNVGESVKKKIIEEFSNVMQLMCFNDVAYERVRQWYVDGRLVYHLVVDEDKPSEGIQRMQLLDPRAIKHVREVSREIQDGIERIITKREYYLYDSDYLNYNEGDVNGANRGSGISRRLAPVLELKPNAVVQSHSGIISADGSMVLSHLEKARKPLNNLRMIEDAVVVYRITRAPERRVFYIDTAGLPKKASEEYVERIMNKYQTKMLYNPSTGKVEGRPHQVSMMEDYWLPRKDGKGTEIDTLPGAQNLGNMDDVLYFQRKVFRALNVPTSRLEADPGTMLLGTRNTEIGRDEWKFQKFVARLRRRFLMLVKDALFVQLSLKKVCNQQEWEELIEPLLGFEFAADGFAKEAQEIEDLQNRLSVLERADPYVGKYFTNGEIQRKVLGRTDEEIEKFFEDRDQEIKDGVIPDPKKVAEQELGSGFPNG